MKINPEMVVTIEKLKEMRACWFKPEKKPKLQPPCSMGCCGGSKRLAKRLAAWKESEKERRAKMRKAKKFLGTEGRPLSEVILFWPPEASRSDLCWLIESLVPNARALYPACWLLGDSQMADRQPQAREAFINILKLEHGLPLS